MAEKHVEVLRELRDTGDVSDWSAMESALDAAILALSSPAPAQVGAELATVKEGNWAYTEDGRHVQVWRITQDNGVYCSDLKYHCASKLFAALAPTPQEQATPEPVVINTSFRCDNCGDVSHVQITHTPQEQLLNHNEISREAANG